ncbi:hypothetical protein [Cystobacter fuscus]|uniref:hypothetical protein n=1 Tax=Cystobacter fuscus TaxID=43 RepID=UPI002B2AB884|nr:hypothetical protein F0U63_20905 [Cystobacter fuscus]
MADNDSGKKPNDNRSDVINPNNPKHQKALDEHSRARNPKDPSNTPGTTRPSNPPGQGKR